MKLKKVLDCYKGMTVRIGAEQAYVFIGKASIWKIKKLDAEFKSNAAKTIKTYKKSLTGEDNSKYKRKIKKLYSKKKAYLKNYVPLLKREVIEVWRSIEDECIITIKVEGEEKGKYWFIEEFDKHFNKKTVNQ